MKITKYIIAIFSLLAFSSCTDFLNQPSKSEIGESDYYQNAEEVEAGVIGCYNALHGVMFREWTITELRTDNTRMYGTGSSATLQKEIEQMDQGTIMTSNSFTSDYWDACYHAISRCNKVLENLDVVSNPTLKAKLEGEAKFLRAHIYFNLVRLWGPVFIVTKSVTPPQVRYQQRSSIADVYKMIEDDLEHIVNNNVLPKRFSQKDAELGRAPLEAAQTLLAKVYVTHYTVGSGKYADSKALLESVISSMGNPQTGADLTPYADIFDVTKEMNKEIIFTVRYKAGNLGLGGTFGNSFAPNLSGANVVNGDGTSFNYVSDNIINLFKSEANDLRKDVSLAENYVNKTTGKVIDTDGQCRYIKKYMAPGQMKNDSESDWPIIRMGDVLLLFAEVENEINGNTVNAFKYLNIVRQRAGLTDLTAANLENKYDFRKAVRDERRKELVFENQRWFDLLRWGTAVEVVNKFMAWDITGTIPPSENFFSGYAYKTQPIMQWQTLQPIPQKVMNINPDIAQNTGY